MRATFDDKRQKHVAKWSMLLNSLPTVYVENINATDVQNFNSNIMPRQTFNHFSDDGRVSWGGGVRELKLWRQQTKNMTQID